jgi:flagellin
MSLGVLNNISAIYAQTNLNMTQKSLQNTLTQLSSGSRINSGADDAAGLSIADGLRANQAALTQSAQNAQNGVGLLQTADGALSQVTNLLNRAVTLATEASNGGLTTAQATAADTEFKSILTQIGNIGTSTNYNSTAVFSATATDFVLSDGTTTGTTTISATIGALSSANVGSGTGTNLSGNDLTSQTNAKAALTNITAAVAGIAAQRGTLGASINQLNSAASVASTQSVNLADAENNIRATNYGQATSDMARFKVLSQTGIAALSQANAVQQDVLKLLQ